MSPLRRKPEGEYLRPYREAVAKMGTRFESLLWNSPEAQKIRFEVLAQMGEPGGRVVCDLGCGRADFFAYLFETGQGPARCVGVDGVPELVGFCRTRAHEAGWSDCVFHEHDFVSETGLFESLVRDAGVGVFAISGSLNTFEQKLGERVLGRAFEALPVGGRLVFNFLSDRDGRGRRVATAPAKRFDTQRMVGWALDRTPFVRFRHDYLNGHDATISMGKGR